MLKCFDERHEFFTEKTKRILSLIIGYAVLHLNGTSWLQLGWGSADIKFFQTISHQTPLRPFIQVHLPKAGADVENGSEDDDDDLLDSGHRCPALIALAVVLIEVYFARPFHKLAHRKGIPLDNPDGHITLLDVDQVFNGEVEDKAEGWRSHMPEDSPLLIAIENFLNPELWEDDKGDALDHALLKSRIYQDVVRLLELHLTSGFSKIPLDNIDTYARDLDFGRWGQAIDEPQISAATLPPGLLTPTRTSSPALMLLDRGQARIQLIAPQFQGLIHQYSQTNSLISFSPSLPNHGSMSSSEIDIRASHFFDDEVGDEEHSITK